LKGLHDQLAQLESKIELTGRKVSPDLSFPGGLPGYLP
jgi:hypothetical protein